MKRTLIFILFFSPLFIFSQNKRVASGEEKKWALFHPIAALKINAIYKKCISYYEDTKKENSLDRFESGGKLDAFRHIFFMSAFAQKIKIRKIRKLGRAHERGNYKHFLKNIEEQGEFPDSLASVMDLFNNEVGFKLGSENKKLNLKEVKSLVVTELKKGRGLCFKRNMNGQYVNCNNEIVIKENYLRKWFIPKCLIKTSE